MNSEIERYLKQATRGLWGKRRREVEEELSAHIEGRVKAHLIAGLSESTAVQRTLQELGQPYQVNRGMVILHTMPSLMGLGAVLVSAVVLTVTLVSGSIAQSIPGTSYWPSKACISAIEEGKLSGDVLRDYLDQRSVESCFVIDNSLWLNFHALIPVLEAKGIKIQVFRRHVNLLFPDGERASFTLGNPNIYFSDEDKNMLAEPQYFDLWELIKSIALNPDIPLAISSWDNPTVHIGEASFQVGTSEQPFEGADFHDNYLERVLFTVTSPIPIFGGYVDLVNPRIERLANGDDWDESFVKQVDAQLEAEPTSTIYGAVVLLELDNPLIHKNVDFSEEVNGPTKAFFMSLARANPDGSVSLELPSQETIRFVNKFGVQSQPGDAMLVELTASAGSWFKVVSPESLVLKN